MSSQSKTFPDALNSCNSSGAPVSGNVAGEGSDDLLWLQLAIGYGLILAAVWTPEGPLKLAWVLLVTFAVMVSAVFGRYSWREMGLGIPGARGMFWVIAGGLLLAATVPLTATVFHAGGGPIRSLSWHLGSWHSGWQYAIWAVLQEFILQSFLYLRLESLLGSRRAVLAAATMFAAAHIPSPILTFCTLVGGLFFCEMFRRYRSIIPLGLVHAMLGLTIAVSFSDGILHHMRVGIGYLAFHSLK